MSQLDLVALVCCDLGAIVRGRSLPSLELTNSLDSGVGWVPANHALTPLGPLAEVNPFGSTGDLRLRPDAETHVRLEGDADTTALDYQITKDLRASGHYRIVAVVPYGTEVPPIGQGTYVIWRYEAKR